MVVDLDPRDEIYPCEIESMKRLKKLADMEKENKELTKIFKSFEDDFRKNEGISHD